MQYADRLIAIWDVPLDSPDPDPETVRTTIANDQGSSGTASMVSLGYDVLGPEHVYVQSF